LIDHSHGTNYIIYMYQTSAVLLCRFCDLKPLNQHSAKVMKCFELADIDVFGSLKH